MGKERPALSGLRVLYATETPGDLVSQMDSQMEDAARGPCPWRYWEPGDTGITRDSVEGLSLGALWGNTWSRSGRDSCSCSNGPMGELGLQAGAPGAVLWQGSAQPLARDTCTRTLGRRDSTAMAEWGGYQEACLRPGSRAHQRWHLDVYREQTYR